MTSEEITALFLCRGFFFLPLSAAYVAKHLLPCSAFHILCVNLSFCNVCDVCRSPCFQILGFCSIVVEEPTSSSTALTLRSIILGNSCPNRFPLTMIYSCLILVLFFTLTDRFIIQCLGYFAQKKNKLISNNCLHLPLPEIYYSECSRSLYKCSSNDDGNLE